MCVTIRAMKEVNAVGREVDRIDFAMEELYAPKKLSNRIDDMGDIQIARGDLMEHRREQKEILTVDQSDLYARPASKSFVKLDCRVQTGEAAAEDQDLPLPDARKSPLAHNDPGGERRSRTWPSGSRSKMPLEPFSPNGTISWGSGETNPTLLFDKSAKAAGKSRAIRVVCKHQRSAGVVLLGVGL